MFIIVEKPVEALEFLKLFNNANILCFNSFAFEFNFENFDFRKNQEYKLKDQFYPFRIYNKDGYKIYDSIDKLKNENFVDLSEIDFFYSLDHTSIRQTDLYLNLVHNLNTKELKVNFSNIYSQEPSNVLKCYKNKTNFFNNESINKHRNVYLKKDYLDYHINSITKKIFGYTLTKNMSYLITIIHKIYFHNLFTEHQLFLLMDKNDIGSPVSKQEIIKKLKELEILKKTSNDSNKYNFTNKGFYLLSRYSYFFYENNFIYLNNIIKDLNIDFSDAKPIFDNYFENILEIFEYENSINH